MIFLKIMYHLGSMFKKIFFKIVFASHVKFGKGFRFRRGFCLAIEQNGLIEIGDYVSFNNYCSLNSLEKITIGERCIFGENVRIYDHNHKFRDLRKTIMEQGYATAPVTIGNDCWIGSNVTILKGVNIGNNVIVGTGCVINQNIQSRTIVKCKNELEIYEINKK